MAHLRGLESQPSLGAVVTYPGVVVKDSAGKLAVNVNGNFIYPRYQDPVVVAVGDPVTVSISAGPTGAGDAIVTGRITLAPRPGTGTVKTVPASSATITVTGTDGTDYTATFVGSYSPTVNDNVILAWNANTPTVTGKVGVVAAPAVSNSGVSAPPSAPTTGQTPYAASWSETYWPGGGWGVWAGGGSRVFQGDAGSGPVYGSWFYSGSVAQLAGRTITRIRFTLGARHAVGNSGAPATIHFYTHGNANRPDSGDISRLTGPFDATAQPGQGLTDYILPLSFANDLLNGGGISIAGDPYAGFSGVTAQPESGLLTIDWTR